MELLWMKHECPDGEIHEWVPRVPKPLCCPRCKRRLDEGKEGGVND